MKTIAVGDLVRVINPQCSFGDYEIGDLATVTKVCIGEGKGYADHIDVVWAARRFSDDVREQDRVTTLYPEEVVVEGGAP